MSAFLQALPHNVNPLLALLGITPHRIVPANQRFKPTRPLVLFNQIDAALKDGIEAGVFTADEAGILGEQAVAAGLPIDVRALVIRALDQQVEGELGELSFRLCVNEACTMLPGLGHGEIFVGEEQATKPIETIADILDGLQELVDEEEPVCTPQQAILLMRQAKELGLPLDQAEREERYAALPEETKLVYQQRRKELESKAIEDLGIRFAEVNLDGMRGTLVEIDLGRLLGAGDPPTAPKNWLERMMDRIRTGR